MYSMTTARDANPITFTLSGKVSGREYVQMCGLLREALEKNRSVSLLCELNDFRGIGLMALWRAARVATENAINLRRVAVVGDRSGYKWARALVRSFHAETRYFQQTHRSQAVRWLSASSPVAHESRGGLFGDASYRK